MRRKRVGLWPATLAQTHQWLWKALEALLPLSFVSVEGDEARRLDALVMLTPDQCPALLNTASRVPSFISTGSPEKWSGSSMGGEAIEFERHLAIPAVFRDRTLTDAHAPAMPPLRVEAGDQVVASQMRRPVWIHRPASNDAAAKDVVSLPLPMLTEGAYLRECWHGGNFLCALPLLSFLQRLTAREGWQPAPQRACFVFDDPSLRWSSYGFVDYQQLARHAQAWNYHAAIGLIPLDAAWVSRSVATTFRSNPDRLSLVIHGCNHLRLEMARTYPPSERMALCALALRRVEKAERQHLLSVCRVMESPFGVIDQSMFSSLVALGYEAALVTASQFLHHHPAVKYSPCFGLQPAYHLPGGLGMIPRITIKPHWQTEARLAAFLGQPIVIAGHHQDAANGLEALQEIAETINGYGEVRWCSMTEIARANYTTRLEGETLSVSLGARRVLLPVPKGVRKIIIHRPWIAEPSVEPLTVKGSGQTVQVIPSASAESGPIAVLGSATVEICSAVCNPVNPHAVPAPRARLWPYVRRALTEVRDRTSPLLNHQSRAQCLVTKVQPKIIL